MAFCGAPWWKFSKPSSGAKHPGTNQVITRWLLAIKSNRQNLLIPTRWAPTSYKWSYNPFKWPYNWVTGVVTLLIEVITPHITCRGPTLYCWCFGNPAKAPVEVGSFTSHVLYDGFLKSPRWWRICWLTSFTSFHGCPVRTFDAFHGGLSSQHVSPVWRYVHFS